MKLIDTEYSGYSCGIDEGNDDLVFFRSGKTTARIPSSSFKSFIDTVNDSYYFHMGKTRGRWFRTHENISCDYKDRERGCSDICIVVEWIGDAMYFKVHSSIYEQVSTNVVYEVASHYGFRKLLFHFGVFVSKNHDFQQEDKNMKNVWEVIVIDKEKNIIVCREVVIDGDEKSACSKVSISFSEKLKDFVFDNLIYITKNLGSY